jgi:hypothetical protein
MHRWAICFPLLVLGLGLAYQGSAQEGSKIPPRGKSGKAASRPVSEPALAASTGAMPLLTRFWQLTDSAERTDAAEVFQQYVEHFISYPALALQAGVGGTIYARLTVQPDGRVGSISITRRDLNTGSPPIKAVMALDAELQRVAWQLRFKPAVPRLDSASLRPIARADTVPSAIVQNDSTETITIVQVEDDNSPVFLADTVTIFHRFVPQ